MVLPSVCESEWLSVIFFICFEIGFFLFSDVKWQTEQWPVVHLSNMMTNHRQTDAGMTNFHRSPWQPEAIGSFLFVSKKCFEDRMDQVFVRGSIVRIVQELWLVDVYKTLQNRISIYVSGFSLECCSFLLSCFCNFCFSFVISKAFYSFFVSFEFFLCFNSVLCLASGIKGV